MINPPSLPALRKATALVAPFAYIGQGLPLEEFEAYVLAYDFGTILPDFLVLHHTANPAASWAPALNTPNWDADEAGKSTAQIKSKRKAQLDAIMHYYRDTLHWGAGPHLFIDNLYVWLFTPMHDVGVHAMAGNSYRDTADRLHYSIGIEVVGNYTRSLWPLPIQRMAGRAVVALQRRLKTFDLIYKPAPRNRPDLHVGSIAFHSDFNKPECPGAMITPAFVLSAVAAAAAPPPVRYMAGPHGAIAQQDRRADAPTAKYYTPGEPLDGDDLVSGYIHDHTGIGFVPLGQVVKA